MWKSRKPPVPLDRQRILDGSFESANSAKPSASGNSKPNGTAHKGKLAGAVRDLNAHANANGGPSPSIKDQRSLSLKDSLMLFDDRWASHLSSRCEFCPLIAAI